MSVSAAASPIQSGMVESQKDPDHALITVSIVPLK